MTVAVVCWSLHTCHVDMYHTSNEFDNIKIIFTDQCIHQNFIYNSYMYVCVYTQVPATRVSCSLLKPASYLLPVRKMQNAVHPNKNDQNSDPNTTIHHQ